MAYEPKRRGAKMRDADGHIWTRETTLWHDRGTDSRGRWPLYRVKSNFGPLLLLDDNEKCRHRLACTEHPDQDLDRHGAWSADGAEFHVWSSGGVCEVFGQADGEQKLAAMIAEREARR